MKRKTYILIIAACGILVPHAAAENFKVKAYGDIGLGKGMSISTSLPGMSAKSSCHSFGIDAGYTFWQRNKHSLEANVGLGYSMASAKFDIPELSYDYAAPATADEDGNPYQRYVDIEGLKQNIKIGYIKLPIYLDYQYRVKTWLGLYAEAGIGLGFKCSGNLTVKSGEVDTYGVYPEYDDLVIKADYLNGFGVTNLADANKGELGAKGFCCTTIVGAGVEFYVKNRTSIDLGVRYNAGLTNVFSGEYGDSTAATFDSESAPVTYEVRQGQTVKSLGDFTRGSKLSGLSLRIGVNVRF